MLTKRIFASLIFTLISYQSMATPLQQAIDKLINQVDPHINLGMVVVDLNNGETLYQRKEKQTFIPASNMKLFSNAAALMALGPDYRFQSKLSTNATLLDKGVLNGSIYIHLPGDPSLTQDHLHALMSKLTEWGILRIQGDVVLVSDRSGINAYPEGWQASDKLLGYGAPLAPVMLDENRLTVTVNPAYKLGDLALIELTAPKQAFNINNQVKTVDKSSNCGLHFEMDETNTLSIRGCIGLTQGAFQERLAIKNPLRYSKQLIQLQLTNLHIKLDGQIRLGVAPSSSLLLATHDSKPIAALMADTLKPSDNLYADSMYLQAAKKINGKPLNWQPAQGIVKQFLQKQTGINLNNALFTDGSGLSRNNLVTPEQTVNLLRFLNQYFPLTYEYIAALPIGGFDGTLQRRFRKPTQQGLVRAKTGTMTGIISLSGYLYTRNRHTLAFAMFINTPAGTPPAISGRYRSLVDGLCAFLINQTIEEHPQAKRSPLSRRVAYQLNPSHADTHRNQQAKWRNLELALKNALKNQEISVLFRNDNLVLIDHGNHVSQVWNTLQLLKKRHSFSVALQSPTSPTNQPSPALLWIKTNALASNSVRLWSIQEVVG